MNKLHIETIKTDKNILPIDIYFLLLVGEYTYFSEIIYVISKCFINQSG